jgi:hypothetical protein
VVSGRPVFQRLHAWRSRVLEWGVLLVVLLALAFMFYRQVRVVQGQAELAGIKSTLGALRTAFVLAHLAQAVSAPSADAAQAQRNPFLLLERLPANYAGEASASVDDSQPTGSWIFDPKCVCVAYFPQNPEWLEVSTGALWFRIETGTGPHRIEPSQVYVWQGEPIK